MIVSYLRHGRTAYSMRIGPRVERLAVPLGWCDRWHLLMCLDDLLLPVAVLDGEANAVRWVVEG